MTFGSLFSGIGGMDLGLERAGMVCKWQVEINPFCRGVLAKHWPEVPKYGDITEIAGDELEFVDLIAGGFPCQDVSLAGLRRGVGSGTRSGLYADMLRIVCFLRPRFLLVENVPGLLIPIRSGEPAPISRVCGDLAEIGYDSEWAIIPAAGFGAPHSRERVMLVAHSNSLNDFDIRCPHTGWEKSEDFQWWSGRLDELGPEHGIERRGSYSEIVRAFHGIPGRVDRLRGLGNAVVPQVAEWIGRRILASEVA